MGIESLGIGADAASVNANAVASNVGSTPFLSSGPASALSSITDPISSSIKSVSDTLQQLTGANSLPLPNVLSSYATYDYIIGIGVLSAEDYNSHTYINGSQIPLICKSAHVDPNNRPNTTYGKFDYYIDSLSFETLVEAVSGDHGHVTVLDFDIIEPYSMGMFMLAMQTAAIAAGHSNWNDAPYLLTIEFRGNKETGQMLNIPQAKRFIPFNFATINTRVSSAGTTYSCHGMACSAHGRTERVVNVKSDVAIKGTTVQEALQTGEKSLQAVINARLKEFKEDKIVNVPDEILILFPKDTQGGTGGAVAGESSATATSAPSSGGSVETKLGVTRNANDNLVQPEGECNEFGKSSLGFDTTRKADTPISDDDVVYDKDKHIWVRGNASINPKENNFKFAQDSSIINAIDQVIIASAYPNQALDAEALDSMGRRKWWKVDTQVFYKDTNANLTKTGTKPRLIVYRVIPSNVHTSVMIAPNTKPPGYEQLAKNAVKVYDYIYTGKNTEIISFDIDLKNTFAPNFQADNFKKSQDIQIQSETSLETLFKAPNSFISLLKSVISGFDPPAEPGTVPTRVTYSATTTPTDKKGGGGAETPAQRAARSFQEGIVLPVNLMNITMTIHGDPYWIPMSGTGTYVPASTGIKNLNSHSAVEYLSDEIDIVINFRTPVDINQATGFYNFGGQSELAPVNQYSGLYQITKVKSILKKGQFTQEISGTRRMMQESKTAGSGINTFNVSSLLNGLFGGE